MTQPASGDTPATLALDVSDVLAGDYGAAGVRAIAQHPFRFGLAELTEKCLPGAASRTTYALLRTKYKPGRKLTATYELTFDGAGSRHVCVTWSTERIASLPGQTTGAPDENEVAPFSRLSATTDDGLTSLQVAPSDPTMPQLRRLNDAEHLGAVMGRLVGRSVPVPRPLDVRTVRYRPGERHVLMVRSGPGRPGVFVKTDRDDRGATAVPVAAAMSPLVAGRCLGAHLVEPLGYSDGDLAAFWVHAAGMPLSQQLTQSVPKAIQLVRLFGQAVRAWHDSGAHVPPWLRQQLSERAARDVAAEMAATRRAGDLISVLLPEAWSTFVAVLDGVAAALDQIPPDANTVIHGDLKSDNVLVAGGQLRLIDLDRVAWADPALDLGKFLADLQWWCRDEALASALGAAFRGGYGPREAQRWARADLIAEMYRLMFAARRCVVHDPHWEVDVSRQIADTADALGKGWGR